MTPAQFLQTLRFRWKAVLTLTLITTVTAVGLAAYFPDTYRATASVLVQPQIVDPVTQVADLLAASPRATPTRTLMVMSIARSERVALEVVRRLGLADIPDFRRAWMEKYDGQGSAEAFVVQWLWNYLEVDVPRGTSVVRLSFYSSDPALAAAIANTYAAALLDTLNGVRQGRERHILESYVAHRERSAAAYRSALTDLFSYERRQQVTALDAAFGTEQARLWLLSRQRTTWGEQAASTELTRRAISEHPELAPDRLAMNASLEALSAQLVETRRQLAELSQARGSTHPTVQALRQRMAALESALEHENQRVARAAGSEAAVGAAVLDEGQRTLGPATERAQSERERLSASLALRQRALRAGTDYEQAYQAAALQALNSVVNQTETVALSSATAPARRDAPNFTLVALLAALFGACVAGTAVFVHETRRPLARTARMVEQRLGLAVLGSV